MSWTPCSCESRSPGRMGSSLPPWAPAFAGALVQPEADALQHRLRMAGGPLRSKPNYRKVGLFHPDSDGTAPSRAAKQPEKSHDATEKRRTGPSSPSNPLILFAPSHPQQNASESLSRSRENRQLTPWVYATNSQSYFFTYKNNYLFYSCSFCILILYFRTCSKFPIC